MLNKFADPACPKCGCRDHARLGEVTHWGDTFDKWRCRYCGKTWNSPKAAPEAEPIEPEVAPSRVATRGVTLCPHCDSNNTVITSTRKQFRRHKCRACDKGFKTAREDE